VAFSQNVHVNSQKWQISQLELLKKPWFVIVVFSSIMVFKHKQRKMKRFFMITSTQSLHLGKAFFFPCCHFLFFVATFMRSSKP
jgi:hypothetical protein